MNNSEILDTVPVTLVQPVSKPLYNNKFFKNELRSFLLLLAVYSLIINQAQRNKKQTSLPGIKKTTNIKAINTDSSVADRERWRYQKASFLQLK